MNTTGIDDIKEMKFEVLFLLEQKPQKVSSILHLFPKLRAWSL
jgi:hypothetical protein